MGNRDRPPVHRGINHDTGRPRQTYKSRPLDKDVWQLALERFERLYLEQDQVIISFSGGKDSTVLLQAAIEVATSLHKLPVRVIYYDEEAIPLQTEEYVRRVSQRDDVNLEWYTIPIQSGNACSPARPHWYPWAPEDQHLWVRPKPSEGISLPGFPMHPPKARPQHMHIDGLIADPAKGNAAICLGIRADESMSRRRAVSRHLEDNWLVAMKQPPLHTRDPKWLAVNPAIRRVYVGHIRKAYPIYDMRTTDVWRLPATMGWDYNEAYDIMEMAGVPLTQQRCSPAFANEPLQKLHTYATCFPEIWDAMTERVPGAATAARYARTELYGYKDRPAKPPGLPWPDYLLTYLQRHEPDTRRKTARWIRTWIQIHQRTTPDPIVEDAPHPQTGVSWDWLLALAMRGDPKERKQAGNRIASNDPVRGPKERARYDEELRAIRAAGRLHEIETR
jgi:predicted phosphoadenosine phosphosulfate sulfurtransferase